MAANRDSAVLHALAARYSRTRAARTGAAVRDFLIDYEELLREARCGGGEPRVCAERDLEDASSAGVLKIERHARSRIPLQVRFEPANAARLFEMIGLEPPDRVRENFARIFRDAAPATVPERWREAWGAFCASMEQAAANGSVVSPFNRSEPDEAREILDLLPRLLAWEGESLMRFASTVLCDNSKRLEQLQARLETCLDIITKGESPSLAALGITGNERSLLLHGPLQLRIGEEVLDIECLGGPVRISLGDICRANLTTKAVRCLTVENAAMLHELAKLREGILLAGSGSEGGFAHSATIAFLKKLPLEIECWHFGDSDPAGFDILRDLRERTGRTIRSLHMRFRDHPGGVLLSSAERAVAERLIVSPVLWDAEKEALRQMLAAGRKGRYEQEALGTPQRGWPFYEV